MLQDRFENNKVVFSNERDAWSKLRPDAAPARPFFVDILMRTGVFKNESRAMFTLLGFVVVMLGITVVLFSSLGSGSLPSEEEMNKISLPGSGSL